MAEGKRRRRRTGADRPIDFTSFPDEALLLYVRNLEYHVRKGGHGSWHDQYEAAFGEAKKRELDVTDARPAEPDLTLVGK